MKTFYHLAIFISALCVLTTAHAQSSGWELQPKMNAESMKAYVDTLGRSSELLEFNVDVYRAEGQLYGCGISFVGMMVDWAYRVNTPVRVGGSINYYKPEGKVPAVVLRIGLIDFDIQQQVSTKESSVNYAYLRTPSYNLAGTEIGGISRETDPDAVSGVEKSFIYVVAPQVFGEIFSSSPLVIGFNRSEGGADLEFELNMLSQPQYAELIECFLELDA